MASFAGHTMRSPAPNTAGASYAARKTRMYPILLCHERNHLVSRKRLMQRCAGTTEEKGRLAASTDTSAEAEVSVKE